MSTPIEGGEGEVRGSEVREWGQYLVAAVIVVFAVTIIASVANYVLGQFNNTGITIPGSYNMFKPLSSYFSIIATMIALAILIILVAAIIRRLSSSVNI